MTVDQGPPQRNWSVSACPGHSLRPATVLLQRRPAVRRLYGMRHVTPDSGRALAPARRAATQPDRAGSRVPHGARAHTAPAAFLHARDRARPCPLCRRVISPASSAFALSCCLSPTRPTRTLRASCCHAASSAQEVRHFAAPAPKPALDQRPKMCTMGVSGGFSTLVNSVRNASSPRLPVIRDAKFAWCPATNSTLG